MRSIKLPLSYQNGRLTTTSDLNQIIRQKIIDVLVTSKQERVMIPEYGASTYSLVFDMLDPLVLQDFKVDALQELAAHVTGAQIIDLKITSSGGFNTDDMNTTLSITVYYRIPPNQVTSMTFTVSDFLSEESFL